MKKIIYIGNNICINGVYTSVMSDLVVKFKKYADVHYASSNQNIILRMLDMIYTLLVNSKNCNIVIIDAYSTLNFYYTIIISVISRIIGIPYIVNLHGGDFPSRLRKNPLLCRLVFNNSSINVSPSIYLKYHFEKHGFKVKYIPNSINIDNYKVKYRKSSKFRLLWVRSFHEIYNPQMAIKVVHNLCKSNFNVELCMVGPDKDGSMEKCKKLAKELGVFENIYFPGMLMKKEWIKLSNEYDIFINTTDYDNMPVSIIEAMALGFPIVSTNPGGIPFLLRDEFDAMLVNKNDVNGMVKKITEITTSPDLSFTLSKRARRKAEDFSWSEVSIKWEKLLQVY